MLKRFLVATDGSPSAADAANLAARIVAPHGQIVLMHVVPGLAGTALAALDAVGLAVGGLQGGLGAEWMQRATQEGSQQLAKARAAMAHSTAATIDVATELEVGRPASLILDRLEHGSFDAVAVGGRGHGVLRHVILGSVAAEVMLHAMKPILIARGDRLRRIVVATDGSESATRAAVVAGSIARELDASLSLLAAAELAPGSFGAQQEVVRNALREHFRAAFAAARTAAGMAPTDERLVFQDPVQAILNAASESDLVVVGRRREAGTTRSRIGSVAYRVAMSAHSSVLVVP